VFKVDEFEELGFIAEDFQGGGAEGVGGECAEAFAKDAVLEEGVPVGICELRGEFVLTTGCGEDDGDLMECGGGEDIVGGGVAGME